MFNNSNISNKNNADNVKIRGKSYNNKTVRNKSICKNNVYNNNINNIFNYNNSDDEEKIVYSNIKIKENSIENNINDIYKNNYYVVKVTTTNITLKILKQLFNGVTNCKKKFINKFGNVHGFLNFTNLNDANDIIDKFNRLNLYIKDCSIKLVLHSIPY